MSAHYSKHLGPRSLRGLTKAGDILIPGDETLPAFSQTPCLTEMDRIADWMTPQDRGGFQFLTGLFSYMPSPLIRGLLSIADRADSLPSLIAPPFRLINVGVKGVIYTLYYSDLTASRSLRRELNWSTRCGPLPENPPSEQEARIQEAYQRTRAGAQVLRKLPVSERLRFIAPLKEVIFRNQDRILGAIQLETGKSRSDAYMSEIFAVIDHLEFIARNAGAYLGDRSMPSGLALMGKKSRVWFEPVGTVLCISPWNYPFYQAIVPITSALVCGNSVVYKPSELTPMQGLVESLLKEACIPEDWVQIVYGDGAIGSKLIEQRPDKIFFIGSSRTGKRILEQAAKHLIPVELELGGKDPAVVFADANLDRAVAGVLWGAVTNTGQSCTSVERVYIQEGAFETFRDKMVEQANLVVQAIDKDGSADIGHMTSDAQVTIVADHLADALSKGATLLTGKNWDRKSRKIPPLVLVDVTHEMKVMCEETFGPVIPLMAFKTEDEAIRLANDSEYGLSASVWSKDIKRAERVARGIVTGNVSINNVMLTEGNHALPFGGAKSSGFGRYKGEFGFYAFSNMKSVIIDADSKKIEANWYPYTGPKFRLFEGMTRGLFGRGIGSLIGFAKNGLALESLSQKPRGKV